MRSFVIIEVEHGETTDGVDEALFDFGIGPEENGETWVNMQGIDYTVVDYSLRVDLPPYITARSLTTHGLPSA